MIDWKSLIQPEAMLRACARTNSNSLTRVSPTAVWRGCGRTASLCAVLLFAGLSSVAALGESRPSISIPRAQRPPTLQELLEESSHEDELAITDFRQFDPVDGEPISQSTTAYLSYDDQNLYIGWICKDDPEKIRARLARREDVYDDDRVTLSVDTFHDRKHSYWFDVNPYGVQADGRKTDGQGDDDSWEGLWYSQARFTEDGYIVLQTIPFRTLRFPRSSVQTWGFALGRMIKRNNEQSFFPPLSRKQSSEFVGQFGELQIPENISPGRNLQFIPYVMASGGRYLDTAKGYTNAHEQRIGLDAKTVLKDALTFDFTINPDFSQVESDEPQVTVNQRYEVTYSERRPFFMENASLFRLPDRLFFSRRIVDPQFGAKMSGTVGRWNVGMVLADDRAPGKQLERSDPQYGKRALDEVFRVEREFGHQSHLGATVTNTDFSSAYNRVGSLDGRLVMGGNWSAKAQVSTSTDHVAGSVPATSGNSYYAMVEQDGLHFYVNSAYSDRSPGFRAALGNIQRVDIRKWDNYTQYRWRPKNGLVTNFGPSYSQHLNWDRLGRMQDWHIEPAFTVNMMRVTSFTVEYKEFFELYENLGFRGQTSRINLRSQPFNWLSFWGNVERGRAINYYPAAGLLPSMGNSTYTSGGITWRPQPHVRIDHSYTYTGLSADPALVQQTSSKSHAIFNNHILRTKVNYQFSRAASLRAIVDYNSVLPNTGLVDMEKTKRVGTDVLFTYLLHPGTALYLGYSNSFENLRYNPLANPLMSRTQFPDANTAQQVFVKLSYLFRY